MIALKEIATTSATPNPIKVGTNHSIFISFCRRTKQRGADTQYIPFRLLSPRTAETGVYLRPPA